MTEPIDDPVLNCLLAVCCSPEAQRATFAKVLVAQGVCVEPEAMKVAAWVLEHFDLAPAGTLGAFTATVSRLARGRSGGA